MVPNPDGIFNCLSIGTANRVISETAMNKRSSRSHTIFVFLVEMETSKGRKGRSKLNLVDLAGSERMTTVKEDFKEKDKQLKELKQINQSLTTLSRVILSLSKKLDTIPYRESKLTMILKQSLGGNAITSLICNISTLSVHKDSTLQTIEFAQRAKEIKCTVELNIKKS